MSKRKALIELKILFFCITIYGMQPSEDVAGIRGISGVIESPVNQQQHILQVVISSHTRAYG